MLNKTLLATTHDFNSFTAALKKKCLSEKTVLVKMRNGQWVEVEHLDKSKDVEHESFGSVEGRSLYWYINGKSYTSFDYDLIEFKKIGKLGSIRGLKQEQYFK